jgi:hypothetical protein
MLEHCPWALYSFAIHLAARGTSTKLFILGLFCGMGKLYVRSKGLRQFPKITRIWTKLRVAQRTLIVTQKLAIAIFGSGEVRDCFHAQVYALE